MDLVISGLYSGLLGVWFYKDLGAGIQIPTEFSFVDAEKGLDAKTQLPLLQRLDLCLRSPESDTKGGPGQLMGSGWFWIWDFFGYRPALGQSRALLNSMH